MKIVDPKVYTDEEMQMFDGKGGMTETTAQKSYRTQCDPDTSEYECFFHYTDELLYCAGFEQGVKQVENDTLTYITYLQSIVEKRNQQIDQLQKQLKNESI